MTLTLGLSPVHRRTLLALVGQSRESLRKMHSLTSNNFLTLFEFCSDFFFHRNESGPRPVKIHAPATPYQLDHMIAYLERNPHLAMRKFQTQGSSYDPSASWEQLAEELNALWKNGAPKDAKTWKSVSLSANLFFGKIICHT